MQNNDVDFKKRDCSPGSESNLVQNTFFLEKIKVLFIQQ